MDDIILKGIGIYLILILESVMVFVSYLIGHFVNTIPAELAVFMATLLGGLQVLLILIIRYHFKVNLDDFVNSLIVD